MKHAMKMTLTALAALGLTACGAETSDDMDDSTMDHSKMSEEKIAGDTGQTKGVIFSISPDGKEATIDHQEIEGVDMGAMTMSFGITSIIDLSDYAKGDNVSFMIKKGRDGSYRITAICDTDIDGDDCLDTKVDHSGH